MIKFEQEINNFFDIMRNSLKVVFVNPRFCMRVFIVKNEGNREILFDKTRNSLKTMFVKMRIHCSFKLETIRVIFCYDFKAANVQELPNLISIDNAASKFKNCQKLFFGKRKSLKSKA